jgi:hypothetical protein
MAPAFSLTDEDWSEVSRTPGQWRVDQSASVDRIGDTRLLQREVFFSGRFTKGRSSMISVLTKEILSCMARTNPFFTFAAIKSSSRHLRSSRIYTLV